MPYKFMLWSTHLIKQSPLSVFTHWLFTGKRRFFRPLRPFLWMCFSGLVHVNSQLHGFASFFFQELVISCYLWCLSAVLQFFQSCCKPPRFLLFSVVLRFLEEAASPSVCALSWARQKPILWVAPPKIRMLNICSTLPLSPEGEVAISVGLCLLHHGSSGADASCAAHLCFHCPPGI